MSGEEGADHRFGSMSIADFERAQRPKPPWLLIAFRGGDDNGPTAP